MHAGLSTVSNQPIDHANHKYEYDTLIYICATHTLGVSRAGLIDWLTVQDFRWVMEVNFFAVVSVTKAFLPSLKKVGGCVDGWRGSV